MLNLLYTANKKRDSLQNKVDGSYNRKFTQARMNLAAFHVEDQLSDSTRYLLDHKVS